MCPEQYDRLVLEPFAGIHDSRYSVYFHRMSAAEYQSEQDKLAQQEKEALELDRRTVDRVKPGEQQPETDHQMKVAASAQGYFNDESWRDAGEGGFFSYRLSTGGEKELTLRVRYWGDEKGPRQFDILADGQQIATEDGARNGGKQSFVDKEYQIPAALLEGKDNIEIKFQPKEGNRTGRIFHVALLKKQ